LLNFEVNHNPFNCDCKDYDIISFAHYFARSHQLDRANCGEPPDLYNWRVCPLYLFTARKTALDCRWSDQPR